MEEVTTIQEEDLGKVKRLILTRLKLSLVIKWKVLMDP